MARSGTTPHDIAPHDDDGFFGPGSVTWKVFSHPTSPSVAFLRTVAIEVLEPFVLASVTDTGSVMRRPKLRYDRTLQYTATIVFGSSGAVVRAADTLMRIHRDMVGPEPVGGGRYDANHPAGQLWIHLTQWHSVLYVYERFGPGRLSDEEERQYWAECRRAAAFQTIDPDDVPRDRHEVRAYFASMRPRLAGSETAHDTVRAILDVAPDLLPETPLLLRPLRTLVGRALGRATVATLPGWMRRVAGVRQSQILDVVVTALMRVGFRVVDRHVGLQLHVLRHASPLAYPVIAPVLAGVPARRPGTTTPAEAWRAAGRPTPREQYADQLARRRAVARPRPQADAELPSFS